MGFVNNLNWIRRRRTLYRRNRWKIPHINPSRFFSCVSAGNGALLLSLFFGAFWRWVDRGSSVGPRLADCWLMAAGRRGKAQGVRVLAPGAPSRPQAARDRPRGHVLPSGECSSGHSGLSGRRCPHPGPLRQEGAPRSWATATAPPPSDGAPILPTPGRAEPRSAPPRCAQRLEQAHGPAVLLARCCHPPTSPTERRPICGSRRTNALFLVTRR